MNINIELVTNLAAAAYAVDKQLTMGVATQQRRHEIENIATALVSLHNQSASCLDNKDTRALLDASNGLINSLKLISPVARDVFGPRTQPAQVDKVAITNAVHGAFAMFGTHARHEGTTMPVPPQVAGTPSRGIKAR